MFRAIKRIFIWMGLMAEKATETDAINQAVVERGIRDARAKADKAHYANGQLAGQVALLRDQVKREERKREDLQGMLAAAAAANDEANGAHYAEELATLEQDLKDNVAQLESLEQLYQQNTEIIAQSLREISRVPSVGGSQRLRRAGPGALPSWLLFERAWRDRPEMSPGSFQAPPCSCSANAPRPGRCL